MVYKDRSKQLDAQRRSSQERTLRNLKFVNDYKSQSGCLFCGEMFSLVLDLHHINDKEYGMSKLVNTGRSLDLIKKEMKKCVVVCCKCHRKLHAGLLTIPSIA